MPRRAVLVVVTGVVVRGGLGEEAGVAAVRAGDQRRGGPAERWHAVNAPHLTALVRADARFERGHLVERPEEAAA
ncbi:hypothetical protein ACFRQM_41215 [Streptomyces sp. NPDC056831]|uniref:hypothetical protein n=1 Tax=Streptomyces sp. NPDC056831 TaxID=3345954 RepID=UPI00368F7794